MQGKWHTENSVLETGPSEPGATRVDGPAFATECNGIEIRDARRKEMFRVDDAYINGHAALCGKNATLVYLCLCRHAGRTQEAFPSIKTMAKKLSVSRDSVMRGIKELLKWNIIAITRTRRTNKTWLNNTYILLDKSVWRRPSSKTNSDQVAKEDVNQVVESDTKESHKEKDIHKEGISAQSALEINPLINLFEGINPSYERLLLMKSQRDAARRLLELHGLEDWRLFLNQYVKLLTTDKYCPRATTPYQLETKLGEILAYGSALQFHFTHSVKSRGRGLEV